MSQPDQIESVAYTGRFPHRIDEGRRFMVPSHWRSAERSQHFTIIPWPIPAMKYLLVLPPARWNALMQNLNAMSLSNEQAAAVERVIGANSARVVMDGNGRLALPEAMVKRLNIQKEVMLVGRLHKFEIWNPDDFAASEAGDLQVASLAMQSLVL